MKDPRVKILAMFKEGKLDKEEALELLEAVEDYGFEFDMEGPDAGPEVKPPASADEAGQSTNEGKKGQQGSGDERNQYDKIVIHSTASYNDDLKAEKIAISGMGNFTGSVAVGKISISGMGKFQRDVTSQKIGVSGVIRIGGKTQAAEKISVAGMGGFGSLVETDKLSVSGKVDIGERLTCSNLSNSGHVSVGGEVQTSKLSVSGVCQVGQSLDAKEADVSGILKTGGNADINKLKCSGVINIGGDLNADTIYMDIYKNKCNVKGHIRAQSITVEHNRGTGRGKLEASKIYAEKADLVDTRARLLKGRDIKLGNKCIIERVEYYGSLDLVDGAVVKESVKLD
ncbi:MAG TPA: hypothetical protein VFD33_03045 [Bacillota bacterium]|nr:hypothetical protein [Bacillota bacterium]